MRKRRYILTPDEWVEMAQASFEAVFGGEKPAIVEKAERPIPTLLPKPVRVQTQTIKGTSATIAELRKAQRAERKRQKFNKKVRKNAAVKANKLNKVLKAEVEAAKAVYKTCNKAS